MEQFWMTGLSATNLVEVRSDIEAVDEDGFWAIAGTFEGQWTLARFKNVEMREFEASEEPPKLESWSSSKTKTEFIKYVEDIKKLIAVGEVYQVNACRILSAELIGNKVLSGLLMKILKANPAPFAGYLSIPGLEIVSASPERFISKVERRILSSPIKGTSKNQHFLEKDRAENIMIVDLIRNDLGLISEVGSVSTPRLLATEAHPGLFHLVSDVSSEIKKGLPLSNVLQSVMPPGSVSGAPKHSAVEIIRANEGARGPYCGVFGWSDGSRMELAVTIRTFWREDSLIKFGTGAGITWDSDPEMEWEETELKARHLLSLLQ